MSKLTRNQHTPEQKTKYWKARIFAKMQALTGSVNPQISQILEMCKHIGVSESTIEKFQEDMQNCFENLQKAVAEREE